MSSIQINLVESRDEGLALWRALEKNAAIYVFQTSLWASVWLDTVGKSLKFRPRFFAATKNGKPMALFPLGLMNKRKVLRVLGWLGSGFADYSIPLFHHDLTDSECRDITTRVCQQIQKDVSCDLVLLNNNPEFLPDGKPNPMLNHPSANPFDSQRETVAPCVELAGWETYYQSIKKSIRADSVRQKKRLGELGTLRFAVAGSLDEALKITQTMIEQKAERYIQMKVPNMFVNKANGDFFIKGTNDFWPDQTVHVSALYLNDKIIATHWGFLFGARLYFLMPSYDFHYHKFSAGRLHMEELIKWCCENGVKVFDFCNGAEAYKNDWAKAEMKVVDLLSCESVSGRLARPFLKGFKAITRKAS